MKQYSLQRWASTFQVIEAEARKNPMLSPEGIRREKSEAQKPSHQTFTLVDPIPDYLRADDGLVMTSCLRAWYHRYQEEKKMLRGHMEKIFDYLLDIKAVVGIETKDGEREDYVGTVWEIIRMAKNFANKEVSLTLQAKEALEQLKARAILDTANIKAKLSAVREGEERAEHEQYNMDTLQSQLDDMKAEIIKIYRI